MAAMPRGSTYASMVASGDNHAPMSPGISPSVASGWPTVVAFDNHHLILWVALGRGQDYAPPSQRIEFIAEYYVAQGQ